MCLRIFSTRCLCAHAASTRVFKNLRTDDTGMHRYDPIRVFEYACRPIPIPIRVLCALVSQSLISLYQAGRENAAILRNGWHTPSKAKHAAHQLERSVSFTTGQFVETLVWLTVETVVITACWWGVEAPQNLTYSLHEAGGGNDWWNRFQPSMEL